MRVDANPAAAATPGELDPVERVKQSVAALRRRWYVLLVPLLLGALFGWFSAPQAVEVNDLGIPVPTTRYYRATHVLISETRDAVPSDDDQSSVNLAQAAYLVDTGEVPLKVAETLGVPVDDVEDSLLGLPRQEVQSVEVQAIGTDQDMVVELSDAAAAQLLVTLQTQADTDADSARDQILAQLDDLDVQIKELDVRLAGDPPDRPQLEAQQRSLANQYSLVYEQFSQLANTPEPTAGLTSLEGARAEQISKDVYDQTVQTIREGADYVTGATTTVPENAAGSDEPGEGASRSVRTLLGGVAGLVAGVAVVLLMDRFDRRLRRREDVEAATGLTVVAEIPPLKRTEQRGLEVVAHTQPRSRAAEAYRVVRGAVMFRLTVGGGEAPGAGRGEDREAIVLMVTSASPTEGKTTTVANLAAVLAEGGLSVMVINCDFRRPRVKQYLIHREAEAGAEAMEVDVPGLGAVVVSDTEIDKVRLVTGIGEGDPDINPLQVVAAQRKVIEMARPRFDVILLDTAPFLTTNDASELLAHTDQVLLVVRGGKTKVDSARRTGEILERFAAPVLGVVLNDSDDSPAAQYYYGYGDARSRSSRGRDRASGSDQAGATAQGPATNGQAETSSHDVSPSGPPG